MRVTEAVLKETIGELNLLLNLPKDARDEQSSRWVKGAYDLRYMNDGYYVVKLKTVTTGAIEKVSPDILHTPKELYSWLLGVIQGISLTQN